VIYPERSTIGYIFPSPLHRWFVEGKLFGFNPTVPPHITLLQFSTEVIRSFSPLNLANERRIGPGFIQRPLEAQYQDEFYRSCHELSRGSTITFPEFGTAKGRVDFYIPARKWGIELLRDGRALEEHWGRFSSTGIYTTTLALDDYIILDFRVTSVKEHHPSLRNLYHIVFSEDFWNCQILTNTGVAVESFRLLYQ